MRTLAGICCVALLLYFLTLHRLGARELWSSHEARAAQDAQTILEGADWRLPRLYDGRLELQKPPLYYWLTAIFGKLQGSVDEVVVRLPSVLGFLLSGLAVFTLLYHGRARLLPSRLQQEDGSAGASPSHEGVRAAWLSMLILWTMIHFTWMSRVGRIDMPLTAACSWCIVSFVLATQSTSWTRLLWLLLGYIALAAGLMLKGPIAVVLTGLVIVPYVAWLFFQKQPTKIVMLSLTWGIPLVAMLVLPWAWWVNTETNGRFVQEFIIKHNVQRGLGGDEQLDGHEHPWWFYLARFWVDTAPWGWLLPVVIVQMWRRRLSSPWLALGLWWFTGTFLLLSMMQYKRADYLLPAYPGLALALGIAVDAWLKQWSSQRQQAVLRWGYVGIACLALGWFSYAEWILPRMEPERQLGPFAHTVREYLPRPGQVILFRIDSHHLTWELGRTTERIWEWENLGWWAIRPAPIFVIMPKRYADECKAQLPEGELIPLSSTFTKHEHEVPLVLFVNAQGKHLAQK
jgi:4-amino-4-deoxy-L-arabinose transferase-like glycosyltransferase